MPTSSCLVLPTPWSATPPCKSRRCRAAAKELRRRSIQGWRIFRLFWGTLPASDGAALGSALLKDEAPPDFIVTGGEPEPELNNRVIYQPRGKVLGGTSSINSGNAADYDEWRRRGCEGGTMNWSCPTLSERRIRSAERTPITASAGRSKSATIAGSRAWRARCTTPRSRLASRPIPTSTARPRKASATTRPPSATRGDGRAPRPI